MRVWALMMLVLSLSGCLSTTPDVGSDQDGYDRGTAFHRFWFERAVDGTEHDHAEFGDHQGLSTPNFEELGWNPLTTEHGTSPGGWNCGSAVEASDGQRLGVTQAQDTQGILITDLTDPEKPQLLGELYFTATDVYDVALTPDGRHVALVTWISPERAVPLTSPPALATWTDRCGRTMPIPIATEPIPRPYALLLVDLSDPMAPQIVAQETLPGMGHGVFTTDEPGETWILATTDNGVHQGKAFTLFRRTADNGLERVSMFVPPLGDGEEIYAGAVHSDGWIHKHPGTGRMIGWLLASTRMYIVDYENPSQPTLLASWAEGRPLFDTTLDHALHSIFMEPSLRDGRHYTFVGPEHAGQPSTPTGIIWGLDTTDPTAPIPVAAWTIPALFDWGTANFSPHYMNMVGNTLFVSMYHGGIWAVDTQAIASGTPEALHLMPSVGVYIPANEPPVRPVARDNTGATPHIFEVLTFPDGTLATFESNSGVYTFKFDANNPAPPPEPWPISI